MVWASWRRTGPPPASPASTSAWHRKAQRRWGRSIYRVGVVPGSYSWVSNSDNTKGAPNPGLVIDGITIPEPGSDPVTADCGTGPLTVLQGTAGSRTVTATDPDGTVVSLAISSAAVAGVSIGATTPAASVGGTASATSRVAGTTAPGTYPVEVTACNNDAEPQTDDCTLTITVTPSGPSARCRAQSATPPTA